MTTNKLPPEKKKSSDSVVENSQDIELSERDLDAVTGGTGDTTPMKLGDIKGESSDAKHKTHIEILS